MAELHTATPNSGVPPLYSANIQILNGTPFDVPSVAPELTIIDNAPVTAVHTGVPVASVVERNGIETGLLALGAEPFAPVRLIVSALAPALTVNPRLIGTSKP